LALLIEPLPQGVPDRVLRELGLDSQAGKSRRFFQVLVPALQGLNLLDRKVADGPRSGFILVCHALASQTLRHDFGTGKVVGRLGLQMVNIKAMRRYGAMEKPNKSGLPVGWMVGE